MERELDVADSSVRSCENDLTVRSRECCGKCIPHFRSVEVVRVGSGLGVCWVWRIKVSHVKVGFMCGHESCSGGGR